MNDYIITYTLYPSQRCQQVLFENLANADIALMLFNAEVKAPKNQTIKVNSVEIG